LWVVILLAGLTAASLTIVAAFNYPGQPVIFWGFVTLSCLMVVLVAPKPRLYGYTFLAVFLFLGFYAKTVALLGLGIALVEPTGNFDGTGASWDAAVAAGIAGCTGVVAVRVIHLTLSRFAVSREHLTEPVGLHPPTWYLRYRIAVIAAFMASIIGMGALNLLAALYEVGVVPRLVLPLHLNVLTSWVITTGFALLAATLFVWEVRLYPQKGGLRLMIPFVEAIVSLSTLSRAAYLFRALPYLAVLAENRAFYKHALTIRWRRAWLLLLPAGFVLSLIGVSVLRTVIYPSAPPEFPATAVVATPSPVETPTSIGTPSPIGTPRTGSTPAENRPADRLTQRLTWAAHEISTMVVGRWIGIEGTMAVSSYQGRGLSLFGHALLENPRTGESSTYQRISGSSYNTSDKFVFLTIPGTVAILDYSGSLPLVALAMAVLMGLLLIFEVVALRLLANPFAVAVLSLTLANAIAQADFPYLLLVAFLEQCAAVGLFGILLRMGGRTRVIAAEAGSERVSKDATW
jgi:hypothetical protein